MKKIILVLAIFVLGFGMVSIVDAQVNSVTPSTNNINRTNGWAHVDQLSVGVGTINLQFISTRDFWSCFEYRVDNEPNTVSGANPNSNVIDGRWTQVCVNNSQVTKTILANGFVDVRMVYGAEEDERFDWTRFNVLYPRTAEITAPTSGQDFYGLVSFTAYLNDDNVDAIQWAVRQGTCDAGVGTVFGNVDGHSDVATINQTNLSNQTFSFVGDMSQSPLGKYCFVYNPIEDSGEANIRKTVEFNLIETMGPPTDIEQCKKDKWKAFNNPGFKNQGQCVSYVQSNENAGKRQ